MKVFVQIFSERLRSDEHGPPGFVFSQFACRYELGKFAPKDVGKGFEEDRVVRTYDFANRFVAPDILKPKSGQIEHVDDRRDGLIRALGEFPPIVRSHGSKI